jgi:hypothetical protein
MKYMLSNKSSSRTSFDYFKAALDELDSALITKHHDTISDGDNQEKYAEWRKSQEQRVHFMNASILDQARLEFGLADSPLSGGVIEKCADGDNIMNVLNMINDTRRKLLLSQIEYYELLVEYKVAVSTLAADCNAPVNPSLPEYYKNLTKGLQLKLKALMLKGKEGFGIDKECDLNVVKARLAGECEVKEKRLNNILARRTEYERLAKRFGELKREVECKKRSNNIID